MCFSDTILAILALFKNSVCIINSHPFADEKNWSQLFHAVIVYKTRGGCFSLSCQSNLHVLKLKPGRSLTLGKYSHMH